jgi:uncharacterized RDD family membrane protein YckC
MRYVSVGRRFVAILVDGLISLAWVVPLSEVRHTGNAWDFRLNGAPAVLAILLWIAYFTLFEGFVGASPGKLLLGLRVVKANGSKLDASSALLRSVLRIVDAFPYVFPYLVGAVAVWGSPTRQRVGDRVAGSVVVESSSIRAIAPEAASMPPPPPPGG